MKILVTGATGGLGISIIKRFLARGDKVLAIGRNTIIGAQLSALGAEFINLDLVKQGIGQNLVGVDAIVHAAALSSPWGCWDEFYNINFLVTKELFHSANEFDVRKFIFISSPSVYGRETPQLSINEETKLPPKFLNHYAKTKAMAEDFLMKQNWSNLQTIILRPRAIIGPDDKVLLPRFLRLINGQNFPLFNNGEALIEPTDVRDVVLAIEKCIDVSTNLGGEIFNISGGVAMPLRDMIINIAKNLNKDVKFKRVNYSILRPMIATLEKVCGILPNRPEPPITIYTLAALSFSQTFDLTKAREKLDFVPQYNAFETAMKIAQSIAQRDKV